MVKSVSGAGEPTRGYPQQPQRSQQLKTSVEHTKKVVQESIIEKPSGKKRKIDRNPPNPKIAGKTTQVGIDHMLKWKV